MTTDQYTLKRKKMFEDDPEAINYDNYGVIYRPETYTYQKSSASLASVAPKWDERQDNGLRILNREAKKELPTYASCLSNDRFYSEAV